MTISIADIFGLAGVVLAIFCYAKVQWQREFAKNISYSALNMFASVLSIISLIHNWNLASFISNLIWGAISLYGVYRCLKYKFSQSFPPNYLKH